MFSEKGERMKFSIDEKIFEKFPNINIGLVTVKGIDNTGESKEVKNLLREKEKEIRAGFETKTLSENPKIGTWRIAYSSFGAKPKKNKCSVETLYRMILNGTNLRHVNKLVDIYNFISIKHMVPAGGDDSDHINGGITLRFADGTEQFTELNSDESRNPKEGEVVYADEKEILCRRWNWRECDKSKMTEQTKNAALVVEGLPPVAKEEIESIAAELSELVQKHCGGQTKTFILNKSNPSAEF